MTLAGTGHLVTIVCTESGGARDQCHGCIRIRTVWRPDTMLYVRQAAHLILEI